MVRILTSLLFCLLLPCGLNGAIYFYRDAEGRITLTDNPWHNKFEIVTKTLKERRGVADLSAAATTGIDREHPPQHQGGSLRGFNESKFSTEILKHAKRFAVDPVLIKAIIKTESDFMPNAVSRAGAQGLMQLMPQTAADMGVCEPFHPDKNIEGGVRYFRLMLDKFKNNLDLALAAYNAGPQNVLKHNGIPPFKETRNYVKKVRHYYQFFTGRHGDWTPPVQAREIETFVAVGMEFFRRHEFRAALGEFEKARQISPDNPVVRYNIGCVYDMLGQYDESLACYKQAVRLDPFFEQAYYNQAIAFEKKGKNFKAIEAWHFFIQSTKDKNRILEAENYIDELKQYARVNN